MLPEKMITFIAERSSNRSLTYPSTTAGRVFSETTASSSRSIPSYSREIDAIETQKKDSSWNKTTDKYKIGVLKYYLRQLKIKKENDEKSK